MSAAMQQAPARGGGQPPPVLRIAGLSKTFGATLQSGYPEYNYNVLIPELTQLNTTFAGTTAFSPSSVDAAARFGCPRATRNGSVLCR